MKTLNHRSIWIRFAAPAVLAVFLAAGCSEDSTPPLAPETGDLAYPDRADGSTEVIHDPAAPEGLVGVDYLGFNCTFWPYASPDFSGAPWDPVNLIFAGKADPVQIRTALLSLDGDRTAFGFPDEYPFNAVWSDAVGDVQVSYEEEEGWMGSVIQLQLGSYEPVRWHLRLYRTGSRFGAGLWTLGAAHFEVLIPGTADHQVLSWERAEEMVLVDLMRTGLLDPDNPFEQTQVINQEPSFREIPEFIYNALPDGLKMYIGGPLEPVNEPVPIATDGRATIVHLIGSHEAAPGLSGDHFVMHYEQVIPKPICNPDGSEWVLVQGDVQFAKEVIIRRNGRYDYDSSYGGDLMITPWDMINQQPAGEPYPARVYGDQRGDIGQARAFVSAHDAREALQPGGTELLEIWLRTSAPGPELYKVRSECLDKACLECGSPSFPREGVLFTDHQNLHQ